MNTHNYWQNLVSNLKKEDTFNCALCQGTTHRDELMVMKILKNPYPTNAIRAICPECYLEVEASRMLEKEQDF